MCGSLKYAPSLGTGDCDWAFCVLRFGVVPYFHFRFKVRLYRIVLRVLVRFKLRKK